MRTTSSSRVHASVLRTSLILVGVLAGLFAAEVAYRVVLGIQLGKHQAHPTYSVMNGSCHEYDPEIGYRYVPDREVVSIRIKEGYPESCETIRVNRMGGIGRMPEDSADADLRVLVIGDSFTANPRRGGICWPDYLPQELRDKSGLTAEV